MDKPISLDEIMKADIEKQRAAWTPEREAAFEAKLAKQRILDEAWEAKHPQPAETEDDEDEEEEE